MLNILDIIFLSMAFMATFTGVMINNYEKYVPAFIIKGYRYGSFGYRGTDVGYLQVIEVPKAYFRHFYSFASVFSVLTLFYTCLVYFADFTVNRYIVLILRILFEESEPSVSVGAAVLTLSLLTMQSLRRFYETHFLQVFAKSSKMNLSHYMSGIIHYFACIVACIGQSPLFCGNQNKNTIQWTDGRTQLLAIPSIVVFMWAWYEQLQSNIIFANLRRDKKSGNVVTEDHGIPRGRLFEYVSSPHRFCEVIIYTILIMLLPTKTFFCIYLWVLGNQFQTATHAHEWYKKTFKNYPTKRDVIIPQLW